MFASFVGGFSPQLYCCLPTFSWLCLRSHSLCDEAQLPASSPTTQLSGLRCVLCTGILTSVLCYFRVFFGRSKDKVSGNKEEGEVETELDANGIR